MITGERVAETELPLGNVSDRGILLEHCAGARPIAIQSQDADDLSPLGASWCVVLAGREILSVWPRLFDWCCLGYSAHTAAR